MPRSRELTRLRHSTVSCRNQSRLSRTLRLLQLPLLTSACVRAPYTRCFDALGRFVIDWPVGFPPSAIWGACSSSFPAPRNVVRVPNLEFPNKTAVTPRPPPNCGVGTLLVLGAE